MVKNLLSEKNYDSQDSYKRSICVESTYIQNEEIYFYRTVLSGTVLDVVAESIFTRTFFFFLLGMKLREHFGKSEKQGMELMRSNFSFP